MKKIVKVKTIWDTTHPTYIDAKGKELPSVTSILNVMNKPGIAEWANFLGMKRKSLKKELEEAAKLGSLVHRAIELESNDKQYFTRSIAEYGISERYFNEILDQYKTFRKIYNPKTLYDEIQLKSSQYAGTCDNVSSIDGKIHVIDYKTSNKIMPTMFIQLAAYNRMLRERGIKTDFCSILLIPKKCTGHEFMQIPTAHIEKYYEPIFEKLLGIYLEWGENLRLDFKEKIKF